MLFKANQEIPEGVGLDGIPPIGTLLKKNSPELVIYDQ